jgi:hypothetical protein
VDVEKTHEIPAVRDLPDITEVTREIMLETPPEAIFS